MSDREIIEALARDARQAEAWARTMPSGGDPALHAARALALALRDLLGECRVLLAPLGAGPDVLLRRLDAELADR